jgi:hypothetical protein
MNASSATLGVALAARAIDGTSALVRPATRL